MIVKKSQNMKYHFVKTKFIVYLCTFSLPIFFLGLILLLRTYHTTNKEFEQKLSETLLLTSDGLDSFLSDENALQLYLENGNQMVRLFQMMNREEIDYATSITMKNIAAYLTSINTSKKNIDSVYLYIDNKLDRIITSDKMITNKNYLADQGWWEVFEELNNGSIKITYRMIFRDANSSPYPVCSIFRKFNQYNGGIVINYSIKALQKLLQASEYYKDQKIILADNNNNIIYLEDKFLEEFKEKLNIRPGQNISDIEEININNSKYIVRSMYYPPIDSNIITLVPNATVYEVFINNAEMIFILVIMTVLSSAALSYYRAIKNYQQLHGIIEVFDRAEKNLKTPKTKKENDLYSRILNNIIQTFIENSYLQVQLSERKYKQIATELIALQYQINPHFLFNTLQTINYEVLNISSGRMTQANKMLEYLSDILRFSLESPETLVSLKVEIENTKKYLSIQQIRFDNQFDVIWDVDRKFLSINIQRLLLQPLIENSISHGIKNEEGRKILIRIYAIGDIIRFKIIDNGSGIKKNELKQIKTRLKEKDTEFISEHIGLTNINQRLILAYSEESQLHILSKEGMGTIIYFDIPVCDVME